MPCRVDATESRARMQPVFLSRGEKPTIPITFVTPESCADHRGRLAAGAHRFARYAPARDKAIRLEPPEGIDAGELAFVVEGMWLARDLINTPANDMGPAELEYAARALAAGHDASVHAIIGDDLLKENFPLI